MLKESTYWYLFLLAGLFILVLLSIHMTIMHLDQLLVAIGIGSGDVLKFQSVLARGRQSFFMVSYIILLGAALYHGLYGLRTILFELNLKKGLQTAITAVLLIGGLGIFVYGTYVAIAAKMM